jgi:hypothetical protein
MFIEGKRKELPSPKAPEVSGQSLAINISPRWCESDPKEYS